MITEILNVQFEMGPTFPIGLRNITSFARACGVSQNLVFLISHSPLQLRYALVVEHWVKR